MSTRRHLGDNKIRLRDLILEKQTFRPRLHSWRYVMMCREEPAHSLTHLLCTLIPAWKLCFNFRDPNHHHPTTCYAMSELTRERTTYMLLLLGWLSGLDHLYLVTQQSTKMSSSWQPSVYLSQLEHFQGTNKQAVTMCRDQLQASHCIKYY